MEERECLCNVHSSDQLMCLIYLVFVFVITCFVCPTDLEVGWLSAGNSSMILARVTWISVNVLL